MKVLKNIILLGEILLVVLLLIGVISKVMGYDTSRKEALENKNSFIYNEKLYENILD